MTLLSAIPKVPDWITFLASLCAAIGVLWTFIARIRNSGSKEIEEKYQDREHEAAQNLRLDSHDEQIKGTKELIERIQKELEALKGRVSEIEGVSKKIERLERQLDDLLITLINDAKK